MNNPGIYTKTAFYGLYVRKMGAVTLDVSFGYNALWVRAIGAGDIVWRSWDGEINFFKSAGTGEWLPLNAVEILSTGTDWEGVSRTTTATDMWWLVGDSK